MDLNSDLPIDAPDEAKSESGHTRSERQDAKPADGNKATIVSAAVDSVYGAATKEGATQSNGKEKRKTRKKEDYTAGEVLEKGRWLWITPFENRGGSFSFRVKGQLPVFTMAPPLGLLDRRGRQVLFEGQKPRYLRDNYDSRPDARSFMNNLEDAYEGVKVTMHSVKTRLTDEDVREYEVLHLRLKPYLAKNPYAIKEAGDLYENTYGNLIKPISVQRLFELMVELESPYLTKDWLDKIRVSVNAVCRALGSPTESFDHKARNKYDMDLGDVTADRLERSLKPLPYRRAREILRPFKRLLKFGADQHYIRENVANAANLRQTLAEKIAEAMAEITIDNIAQVQIALDIAAKYEVGARGAGYFVPHVVFMYYAAMRPLSELRQMNPLDARLHKKLIRLWSTKKRRRRIKTLSANAVAVLEHYWDGKPLSFEGWDLFWKLVQAAQGYDVKRPAWFKAPYDVTVPAKSDVPRHTGCSHSINRFKDPREAVREDDHLWDTFRNYYDGLATREETAQFCSLLPASMPVTEVLREAIRKDLIKHELIEEGQQIPTAPEVPDFDVTPPQHQLWLPTIPDDVLRDKLWNSSLKVVATEQGTDGAWLNAVCRAKRIPLPKAGRASREKPQDAPLPPPVTTVPHDELEKIIKELHGVAPAAKKLGIQTLHLSAYCAVHKVPVPDAHALALHYNNRPRVTTSRAQVQAMLGQSSFEDVASSLKVTPENLRRYCERHKIKIDPAPPSPSFTTTLDDIRAAVIKDLETKPRIPLETREAMELVLSKTPQGLSEEDLILMVEQAVGIKLTKGAIKYVLTESAKGRFERRYGRIRLIGAYETKVDLDHLKSLLKRELGRRDSWSLIEALRCAAPKTPRGLSVDQLLEVLQLFGINLDRPKLKKELKRLDRQGRVTFYYNQVTIPEGAPNWKLRVHDKESTPGFEAIKKHVHDCHAKLANPNLTNVETMKFILSMAPDGLWQDELIEVAATCGIKFKWSCIHSVVENEAKGEFKRENGRVRLVGAFQPKVTMHDIRNALPAGKGSVISRRDLILEVLKHFPRGLSVDDLRAAAELRGHKQSRDTFRRQIYSMAKRGQVAVESSQVRRPDLRNELDSTLKLVCHENPA
ncbi:MAG: hypothetical protein ABSA83_07680 [Verrucomicrobiota bacterium]|jgi:hypothetical protein